MTTCRLADTQRFRYAGDAAQLAYLVGILRGMAKVNVKATAREDGVRVRAHERRRAAPGPVSGDAVEAGVRAAAAAAAGPPPDRVAAAKQRANAVKERIGEFWDWESERIDLEAVRGLAGEMASAGWEHAPGQADKIAESVSGLRSMRDRWQALVDVAGSPHTGQASRFEAMRRADDMAQGSLRETEQAVDEHYNGFVADAVRYLEDVEG